jgi:hypothetical protein
VKVLGHSMFGDKPLTEVLQLRKRRSRCNCMWMNRNWRGNEGCCPFLKSRSAPPCAHWTWEKSSETTKSSKFVPDTSSIYRYSCPRVFWGLTSICMLRSSSSRFWSFCYRDRVHCVEKYWLGSTPLSHTVMEIRGPEFWRRPNTYLVTPWSRILLEKLTSLCS